jgi:hypothetical protein
MGWAVIDDLETVKVDEQYGEHLWPAVGAFDAWPRRSRTAPVGRPSPSGAIGAAFQALALGDIPLPVRRMHRGGLLQTKSS